MSSGTMKNNISKQNAIQLLKDLQTAVESNDSKSIETVCTLLSSRSTGSHIDQTVSNVCETLLGDAKCVTTEIIYTSPLNDNFNTSSSFLVKHVNDKNCGKANITIPEEFEGFSDDELEYMKNVLKLNHITLIYSDDKRIYYSGPINYDIQEISLDEDKRELWMIVTLIVLFITGGILVRKSI